MSSFSPIVLDYKKIKHQTSEKKKGVGPENEIFCDKLNGKKGNLAAHFAIVFSHPLKNGKIDQDDLLHASVVLEDGSTMPYPVFEQALGKVFNPQLYSEEEFVRWLDEIFTHTNDIGYKHSHFKGLIASEGGGEEDKIAAIEFAQKLCRPWEWKTTKKGDLKQVKKRICKLGNNDTHKGIVHSLKIKLASIDPTWWFEKTKLIRKNREWSNCRLVIHFSSGYYDERGNPESSTYLVVFRESGSYSSYWTTTIDEEIGYLHLECPEKVNLFYSTHYSPTGGIYSGDLEKIVEYFQNRF